MPIFTITQRLTVSKYEELDRSTLSLLIGRDLMTGEFYWSLAMLYSMKEDCKSHLTVRLTTTSNKIGLVFRIHVLF